jgi:hypothetical protein
VFGGQHHGLRPVGRLGDDLDALLFGQHGDQAVAHDRVVVDDQHPQRHCGTCTVTRVPRPGALATEKRPLTSAARAVAPSRP